MFRATQGSTVTNNTTNFNITDVDTGMQLVVTPRVTPDSLVVMDVNITKSKLNPVDGVELPTGSTTGAGTFASRTSTPSTPCTTISARAARRSFSRD